MSSEVPKPTNEETTSTTDRFQQFQQIQQMEQSGQPLSAEQQREHDEFRQFQRFQAWQMQQHQQQQPQQLQQQQPQQLQQQQMAPQQQAVVVNQAPIAQPSAAAVIPQTIVQQQVNTSVGYVDPCPCEPHSPCGCCTPVYRIGCSLGFAICGLVLMLVAFGFGWSLGSYSFPFLQISPGFPALFLCSVSFAIAAANAGCCAYCNNCCSKMCFHDRPVAKKAMMIFIAFFVLMPIVVIMFSSSASCLTYYSRFQIQCGIFGTLGLVCACLSIAGIVFFCKDVRQVLKTQQPRQPPQQQVQMQVMQQYPQPMAYPQAGIQQQYPQVQVVNTAQYPQVAMMPQAQVVAMH